VPWSVLGAGVLGAGLAGALAAALPARRAARLDVLDAIGRP
jgi:putative ABC transport system permease protein